MQLLFLALALSLMWLHIAALSLCTQRLLPNFHLARASGLLMLVLVLFFMEHFVGLGPLPWLWPLTSSAAAVLLWNQRARLKARGFWRAEGVFLLAFLFAFAWRFFHPNVNVSSERVTDLYYISNYLPGTTLPPLDHWNPPYRFDFYYAFQHYAAALMARLFRYDIGTAYNVAFSLLMALPITLTWVIGCRFIPQRWARLLLVATLVLGGTGLSPLLHLVFRAPTPPSVASESAWRAYRAAQFADAWSHLVMGARFIGISDATAHQGNTNKTLARLLFPLHKPRPDFERRVLPLENFGYQFFLGDYHAPLGSFFLLLLTLALMSGIESGRAVPLSEALLGLTVPVMLITNTWLFPLQAGLLGGWITYRYGSRQAPQMSWLMAGGVIGGLLIYPFMIDFASSALSTPIQLVTADDHTPLGRFVALQWPLLLLMGLGLLEPRWRPFSVALVLTFGVLLGLSEVLYIDDPTGGKYARTNTVMKWWGWIYVGGVASMGSICLGSTRRWVRWPAVVTMLLVNVVAYDVGRFWLYGDQPDAGKLHGHAWATQDPVNRDMYAFLKQSPTGIVLENVPGNAYMESSTYAIFNGKPVLLGWPSHLQTWHGDVPQVWSLVEEIRAFYQGGLDDKVQWLLKNEVRYIVLSPHDQTVPFTTINEQIQSHYAWFGFHAPGQKPAGVWVRRDF